MDRLVPMATTATTLGQAGAKVGEQRPKDPGVVLIFSGGSACARIFRAKADLLELGRLELSPQGELDPRISRKHVRVTFDGDEASVADLGSRNGTFVRGEPPAGQVAIASAGLVRVGGALLLLTADVTPFEQHGLGVAEGIVGGPALRRALAAVALTRQAGMVTSLMISGESGSGKEIAARVFHLAGGKPDSPYSAVNCATIPKDLAERLLFGSRRGAFSGATDASGYVQAADGGTLFLDELAELPLDVQSKLLRMLETREVLRLGATKPDAVNVQICAASWRNLRTEVAEGRFREDLYFRIGQPEVHLPPLRERLEELPWHIEQVLADCSRERPLRASAAFVEACSLRHWPGNVRELRAEVRRAAAAATAQGSDVLTAADLHATAGAAIVRSAASSSTPPAAQAPNDEVAAALLESGGNVVAAARKLGISRNKVRRWLERYALDASAFKSR
jgi:transcriptional regulator with GAF, ATPase, and Fis domain